MASAPTPAPLTGRPTAAGRVSLRRRTAAVAVAAVALGSALLGGAAPASAEVLRPNCTPAGGLYSAAEHPGACWRPFAATSPFNVRLLPNDPRVEPNSAKIVDRLNSFGEPGSLSFGPGDNGKGFGQKSVYFARPSDPTMKVRLEKDLLNGGTWGASELNGLTIRVPDGAAPSQGTDHHMAVVDQASGWVYEFWGVQGVARAGQTLQATWGGRTRIDGSGETIGSGVASASGLSILGGIIRPEELLEGDIPHALYMTVNCTDGTSVAPSMRPAIDPENACAALGKTNKDAPALGARFQLGYSDAEIAALKVPAHAKVLLRAMAHYGLIVMDATGGDAWHLDSEASLDRTSLGQVDPGVRFGKQSGLPTWDGGKRFIWELKDTPGLDGVAGSWTKALRVLKPCVSNGTCPASPAPSTTPDPLWPAGGDASATTPAAQAQTPAQATTPADTVKVSATVSATVAVSAPAAATATATATATASAPIKLVSKKPAHVRKATKSARAKALARAKAKARAKARSRALLKARARANSRAARR